MIKAELKNDGSLAVEFDGKGKDLMAEFCAIVGDLAKNMIEKGMSYDFVEDLILYLVAAGLKDCNPQNAVEDYSSELETLLQAFLDNAKAKEEHTDD